MRKSSTIQQKMLSLQLPPSSPLLVSNDDESYSNAIQFIQNVIDSSIPDPFYTNEIHQNANSSVGQQQGQRRQPIYYIIAPPLSKQSSEPESASASNSNDNYHSSIPKNHNRNKATYTNNIPKEHISMILGSIETIVTEILHRDHQHQHREEVVIAIAKGDKINDDAHYNKTSEKTILLIRRIFNLLIHTVGIQKRQLFAFVHNTILQKLLPSSFASRSAKIVERISNRNNTNSSNKNDNAQETRGEDAETDKDIDVYLDCYERLLRLVFEIIPLVVPCNLNLEIELQLLNSLHHCIFPLSYEAEMVEGEETKKKEYKSNVQQAGGGEENDEMDSINYSLSLKKTVSSSMSSSSSSSSHLFSFDTFQSIIQLFQKHIFQNEEYVLRIIVEDLLPRATADFSLETITTTASSHETIKSILQVIYLYLSQEERNEKEQIKGGAKKKENQATNATAKNDNVDNVGSMNTVRILQIIRNIFLQWKEQKYQLKQRNHHANIFHDKLENDVAVSLIPFIKKSQSLAEGYKILITKKFLQKNDIDMNAKFMDDRDYNRGGKKKKDGNSSTQCTTSSNFGWITMDLHALLIIYHCHPIHRNDMKKIIDDLCYEKKFPFNEIQEMLSLMCSDEKDLCVDRRNKFGNAVTMNRSIAVQPENAIIASAIVDLGLYLLLTPLRKPDYPRDENDSNCFFSHGLEKKVSDHLIHPTRQILINTQSLIKKVYFSIPMMQKKQEDLINSLLQMSSHTTFIPKMVKIAMDGKLFDDKISCANERKKNRQSNNCAPMPYNLHSFMTPQTQNKKTKVEIRNIYDVSIQALSIICAIFNSSSPPHGYDWRKIRSIIKGRINYFISSPSLLHLDNLLPENKYDIKNVCAVVKDEIKMLNLGLFDKYCSVLVILSSQEIGDGQKSSSFNEVKQLFHKLLFSSTYSFQGEHDGRVMGIILGKNMMRSPIINETDQNMIFQSVGTILVPSTNANPTHASDKLEPVIGYWGLSFLSELSLENGREEKAGKVCQFSVSFIFKYVKAMISQTGIVQLESEFLSKQKQSGEDLSSVLAYQSPPTCFHTVTKQKRKMVYCISTFLNKNINMGMKMKNPYDLGEKIIQLIRYINALIDGYLNMGRFMNPKWSPDPWLSASIELFPTESGSSDYRGPELLSHLSKGCAEKSEVSSESSLKQATTFIISIVLLRAVLTNAHEHYSHSISVPSSTEKRGWNLMQLVLAKIYDLQKQYHQCLDFYYDEMLYHIGSTSASRLVYHDLISIGSCIFESTSLIPLHVLWKSAKEAFSRWNAHFLGQNVSTGEFLSNLDAASRQNLVCQLWLKHLMLQEMSWHYQIILHSFQQMRPTGENGKVNLNLEDVHEMSILDKEGLRALLQVIIELVTWLQPLYELTKVQEETDIISMATLLDKANCFLYEAFDFLQFVVEKITFLANNLEWLVSGIHEDHIVEKSVIQICNHMTEITSQIDDPFLSSKILDFASLLSTHYNLSVKELSAANWNQFMTIKSEFPINEERPAQLPHSLAYLLFQHMGKSNNRDQDSANKSAVLLNLLRITTTPSPESPEDTILRHHLVSHWAHETSCRSNFIEKYHALIQCIQILTHQLTPGTSMETKSRIGKDCENIPIRSLNIRTIPMAYELVLSMCHTSFVLNISENDSEEVGRLAEMLKVFISIIELYTFNLKVFPERMLDITIQTSSLMIQSCEVQMQQLLKKWNLAKSEAISRREYRSNETIRSVESFVDNVQKYARLILNFCNLIPDSFVDDELSEFDASLTNRKAIISLETRCEGMLSSLREIDDEHNYFLPSSLECLEVNRSTSISSRENIDKYDGSTMKNNNRQANIPKIEEKKSTQSKRKRNSRSKKEDSHISSFGSNDNSFDDSDSFGAVGDW